MKYEWDENKNISNIEKHGISFKEAILIFEGLMLTVLAGRKDYKEDRLISIGEINGMVVIVVIHTNRDKVVRIISARKANQKEREKFYEYLKEKIERDI